MKESVTTYEERPWKKLFRDFGEHRIALVNPMYPDYSASITLERLFQMFKDRWREE